MRDPHTVAVPVQFLRALSAELGTWRRTLDPEWTAPLDPEVPRRGHCYTRTQRFLGCLGGALIGSTREYEGICCY